MPVLFYAACIVAMVTGQGTGLIVWITEYYTGIGYRPVRSISQSSVSGHGTNVIQGLAISLWFGLLSSTALTVLVIPAIFFTGMRSGYLAFVLCGVVWLLWSGRRWLGGIKLGFAALAAVVGAMLFWSTLTQSERRAGGIDHVAPLQKIPYGIARLMERGTKPVPAAR